MTVEEMLRQKGYTDERIKALDQALVQDFQAVLQEAETARQAAEAHNAESKEIERRYNHMYANEIVPKLNEWGTDKVNLEARVEEAERRAEFYRKQNEGARTAGFLPTDAPGYKPPTEPARGSDGRYVAGGNPVPGSPGQQDPREFMIHLASEMDWARNAYEQRYGPGMPEGYSFRDELTNAGRKAMPFRDYFSEKYKFADKDKEIALKKQKDHDDGVIKEARQKWEKELAERGGSNPNLRPAAASHHATVRKGIEAGKWKDPVKLTPEQRHRQTTEMRNEMIASQDANSMAQGTA
jgi:hypothetical protein